MPNLNDLEHDTLEEGIALPPVRHSGPPEINEPEYRRDMRERRSKAIKQGGLETHEQVLARRYKYRDDDPSYGPQQGKEPWLTINNPEIWTEWET